MFAKVMLVGADTPAMKLIANRIESRNLDVQLVGCAGEALLIAEKTDIDVVILNFKDLMSEGLQLLRNLRKKRPQTEVITLSTPSGVRFSMESMKLGVFEDLLMPFDLEYLVGKILQALQRRKTKKGRRSLGQKLEDLAAAACFAEAGDFQTARELSMAPGPGTKIKKEGQSK